MTRPTLILLATLGSAALLAGAFAFQYIGHLAPCHLCLQQRYPHAAAVVIGLLALLLPAVLTRLLPWAGALAALTTAGLGLYHTGVERHWWLGPSTCTSGSISSVDPKDLLNQILASPVIKCDQVAWAMFGVSMASWNMICSLILTALWLWAARQPLPRDLP